MKKLFMGSIALTTFSLAILLFQFSCKKDAVAGTNDQPCNLIGTYVGTSVESTGQTHLMTYDLRENNFAVGRTAAISENITFGGYRNTCDSIFLSVYHASNKSYYLLKGKLSSNGTVISGTYSNLTTTTDVGTFAITK